MNLEAQELLATAERRIPLIDDLLTPDTAGTNKVVLPTSSGKDRIMRAIASCFIDQIEVVGLENINEAEKMANRDPKTVIRNHQDYTFIAVYRHILESVGRKDFVDNSSFPTGMDIYERFGKTLLPAMEDSVMVVAPQDLRFLKRGLPGGNLELEYSEEEKEVIIKYDQSCKNLLEVSSEVLADRARMGRWISVFPEAEISPNQGMLQRAQGEVSRYFLPRGITILPMWQDGLWQIWGPDVDSNIPKPLKVNVRLVIGKPFTTNDLRVVYTDIRKTRPDVTLADLAMRSVYELAPERCDPRYVDFYESVPSIYDYAA